METPSKPVAQQSFLTLLSACEDGALLSELNDRMRDLVAVMKQEQSARGGEPRGALSVSFSFKMERSGITEVSADVRVKEPKTERSRSIFYTLNDNSLSPNNPKQISMDLAPREVEAPPAMRVM